MEPKKLVTILVPAYNEQEVLNMLYERLSTLMYSLPNYDFEVFYKIEAAGTTTKPI